MVRQSRSIRSCQTIWTSLPASLLLALILYVFQSRIHSTSISTPASTTDQCKLHYSHFHVYFTLPPLFILYSLAKPFLTTLDYYKLGMLPIIAFIWTTPWDNELVRMQAWWYPTSCVLARVGYVPIEEYFFFIVQSLSTTLLTTLMTRWNIPRSGLPSPLASLLPLVSLIAIAAGSYNLTIHEDGLGSHYYLSMISWWAAVPLTLLWWGTSNSWSINFKNGQIVWYLASILFSTVYLCFADAFALRRGTWHISEKRSLQIFVISGLPIEEAIFFLATNTILVSACFAFDRVIWKLRGDKIAAKYPYTFAPISPVHFQVSTLETIKRVWETFTKLDAYDQKSRLKSPLEDQQHYSLDILSNASKSFSTAATLLPWDLRVDLGSVYAFARAMDDYIDQPIRSSNDAAGRISLLRSIVKITYHDNLPLSTLTGTDSITDIKNVPNGGSDKGKDKRKTDLKVSALAVKELRDIIPERLWHELIDGYSTDCNISGPHFMNFEDQADYAQCVAGSIGEICVRVILARLGILVELDYKAAREVTRHRLLSKAMEKEMTHFDVAKVRMTTWAPLISSSDVRKLLRDARRMGVCLQLINIARDIAKDAEQLGRCYLVTGRSDTAGLRRALCNNQIDRGHVSVASEDELEVANLLLEGKNIHKGIIFAEKIHLLDLADEIYESCFDAIDLLPCTAARTGLRVACAVYANIGTVIRRRGEIHCLEKSKATTFERVYIALQTIYS